MDVENVRDGTGFPALAKKIAINRDYEAFIFRKFDRLSARNLLHLESRLTYLEWKLDQADAQAAHAHDNETLRSLRAWEAFEENAKDAARPEYARMKIAEEIKETLKEYQEALLRQNQIATLEGSRKRALEVVRAQSHEYVHDHFSDRRRRRPILAGLAEKRLDECNRRDLVAIRRPADIDLLSRFLQDCWIFKKTTKITDETEYIEENHVVWVASAISTVITSILLVGAIVLLHFLNEQSIQLGVIAMFTALFAISVRVLTNARRAEIFASTAAYAAVLVVFVSASPSSSGSGTGIFLPVA